MSILTGDQIAALFAAVNPTQASWGPTMAGIGLFESGGQSNAVAGSSPGASAATSTDGYGGSYGIWQINGSHDGITNPVPPSQGGPVPPQAWVLSMFNPANNAKEAGYLLANGKGLSAWAGDPVGNAALNNGGKPLTPAQVNQALAPYGKSLSGTSSLAGISTSATAGAAGSTSASGSGGCANPDSMSFTLHRTGGCCSNVYAINASPYHFLNECQTDAVLGAMMIGAGALLAVTGLIIILASAGSGNSASALLGVLPGPAGAVASAARSKGSSVVQASQQRQQREHTQATSLQSTELFERRQAATQQTVAVRSTASADAAQRQRRERNLRTAQDRRTAEHRSSLRMQEREHAAGTRRYARVGPGKSAGMGDSEPF